MYVPRSATPNLYIALGSEVKSCIPVPVVIIDFGVEDPSRYGGRWAARGLPKIRYDYDANTVDG